MFSNSKICPFVQYGLTRSSQKALQSMKSNQVVGFSVYFKAGAGRVKDAVKPDKLLMLQQKIWEQKQLFVLMHKSPWHYMT